MLVTKQLTVAIDYGNSQKYWKIVQTYMKASSYSHLFGYQHYSKYLLLCSAESVLNQSILKLFTFSYINIMLIQIKNPLTLKMYKIKLIF